MAGLKKGMNIRSMSQKSILCMVIKRVENIADFGFKLGKGLGRLPTDPTYTLFWEYPLFPC